MKKAALRTKIQVLHADANRLKEQIHELREAGVSMRERALKAEKEVDCLRGRPSDQEAHKLVVDLSAQVKETTKLLARSEEREDRREKLFEEACRLFDGWNTELAAIRERRRIQALDGLPKPVS